MFLMCLAGHGGGQELKVSGQGGGLDGGEARLVGVFGREGGGVWLC